MGALRTELSQSRMNFETKIRSVENEKEKEINCVYVRYVCTILVGLSWCRFLNRCRWLRVKEAIKRKDEAIRTLQSERDAALDQCGEMERLLERQRKELLKLE